MQEHFHFTTDQATIQKQYAAIFSFVSAQLPPILFYLQRRHRHWVKQEDAVIMAIHLLGKWLGFSSERAWHRFVTGNLFTDGRFLERSRYHRRCRALRFAMKWIRHELAKRGQHHAYRRQYAARVVPCRKNVPCPTISRNRGHRILCVEKAVVRRMEASSSSDGSGTSHGIRGDGSVLSRSNRGGNGDDANSSSLQFRR